MVCRLTSRQFYVFLGADIRVEKHAIGEYAKSKGFKSIVIVAAGWYMENHILPEFAEVMGGFPLTPDAEGYLTLEIPRMGGNNEIPFIGIEADYGDLVHGVLLQPEAYNGQLIQAASEMATPDKLVEEFQKREYRIYEPQEHGPKLISESY